MASCCHRSLDKGEGAASSAHRKISAPIAWVADSNNDSSMFDMNAWARQGPFDKKVVLAERRVNDTALCCGRQVDFLHSRMMKRLVRNSLGLGLLTTCIVAAACNDRRRHQPSEAISIPNASAPVPAGAPPRDVARALLTALADAQRARARGLGDIEKKKAYDQALARISALAAQKEIHEQMLAAKSMTIPRDITQGAAVTIVIEAWISEIAHYADGMFLDTLRLTPESPQSDATASVEAENPSEREKLSRIEADLKEHPPKDGQGSPAPPGSPAYLAALRTKTLAQGFNVPINTAIEIRLRKVDDSWRAFRVGLSASISRQRAALSPIPTTLPTGS